MPTIQFMIDNASELWQLFVEHAYVVGIALLIAIATGVPLGIAITFNRKAAEYVLYIAGIIMTIPSVALFGLMIPILAVWNLGIGKVPAIIALVLYSQLPIVRNTYAAIKNIDPSIVDAARGMGMTRAQIMWKVQLPLALGVISAGVRVAVVMSIGIAAIAAYIGAGGLGTYIFQGISTTYDEMLFAGAIAVSLMAIVADLVFGRLENALMPKGLRK
ncbi:ABC transporter permease [Desulfosoma caldarium]|uniref:Osmoprotectant transport system permease protein n=1 Tax=Desulfosoma caldarium TaxID=610254 RepID=A0A3N1ULQ4_9BACT|nr:ABC transporter permease [Desulfosoma caldarium]ROQ92152.1 osmoprotectant transport system permease protein [Desulfosoma caldarium]